MSNLSQGIKSAISLFGAEIITSERLINALADLQAFDFKASRTILRAMIKDGLTQKLYEKYIRMDEVDNLYLNSLIQQYTIQGFQEGYTYFVMESIANALGWKDTEPEYHEDEEMCHNPPTQYTVNGVTFNMCTVIGGKFAMGATSEQGIFAGFDERPAVDVEVDTFSIGETPVTQQLWEAVMDENPSNSRGDNRPVERVTWYDCQEFIKRLNALTGYKFRLPTEAEWEYAARGGRATDHTKYAGTDDDYINDFVWHNANSDNHTHDVKEKQPNELCLYDMSGNVSEWCQDWYYNSYSNGQSLINPIGPNHGMYKVIRGGSYYDKAINCRVSKRMSLNPKYRGMQIGFRLCMTVHVI